jgi:hypothetical protein
MPNFEQDVPSLTEPWAVFKVGVTTSGGFGDWISIADGYPVIPCKLSRYTTDRNSQKDFEGKKPRKSSPNPINEWYARKPRADPDVLCNKKLHMEFLKKKADWRRSRPVRVKPKKPPNKWEYVLLPTGKKVLKFGGINPLSRISRFYWVPELEKSLRPSNRKWTRHNNKLPLYSKVNDLTYWSQTAYVNGTCDGVIYKFNTPCTDSNYLSNDFILGYASLTGNFSTIDWSSVGYTSDPTFETKDDEVMSQAALLEFWKDEIEGVSKIALRRHFLKLQNQKVDLFTELSQGLLTVNMIVDIAKRLAKSIFALKKLDVWSAFKILFPTSRKELANDYLAWKYGIKPLIGDLQGAAQQLAEYFARMAPLKSNGHAKHTFEKAVTVPLGDTSYRTVIRRADIRVKYGTSFQIPFELTRQAATLGFTNPKNVIWELVPFSFVVDWFLPIGDFLQSLCALDGLEVVETYKTVTIHEEYHRIVNLTANDGLAPSEFPLINMAGLTNRGGAGYLQWLNLLSILERGSFLCKREVITLPEVPLPSFKNPLSSGHVASAVALFVQLLKK